MSITQINRRRTPAVEKSEASASAPPIVAIGGVLTVKQCALLYKPILDLDISSRGSSFARFVPPHKRGTGTVYDTRENTRDHLLRVHESLGERKMLLVGHSLGGLIATMFAYEHPETIAGVVCLAGAQEGVKHNTLAMQALIKVICNPEATDMAFHESEFMQEHRARVEAEWPQGAPLHAVSTALDVLLPPPHGFGLRPNGQASTNALLVPRGLGWAARSMSRDITVIPTVYPTGHVNIPVSPPVLEYVREVRDQLSGQSQQPLTLGEAV